MSDAVLAVLWSLLVMGGFAGAVVLRRRGMAASRVRDLLHVGSGAWVFGWPVWERAWVAFAIPWAAVGLLAAVPLVAPRRPPAARVVAAVTSREERWTGLVLYALSFALFTTVALGTPLRPDPAAAALLALAWGDGLGGAVGSRLGRRTYRLPWTKEKSWLGSAVVAVGTGLGILAWSAWSGWAIPPLVVGGAGAVAALAEATAPRGSDNLAVPVAVFVWLAAVV